MRQNFALGLPLPDTIQKWFASVDGQPGFTEEAFAVLRSKAEEEAACGARVYVMTMLDDKKLKAYVWLSDMFTMVRRFPQMTQILLLQTC